MVTGDFGLRGLIALPLAVLVGGRPALGPVTTPLLLVMANTARRMAAALLTFGLAPIMRTAPQLRDPPGPKVKMRKRKMISIPKSQKSDVASVVAKAFNVYGE